MFMIEQVEVQNKKNTIKYNKSIQHINISNT